MYFLLNVLHIYVCVCVPLNMNDKDTICAFRLSVSRKKDSNCLTLCRAGITLCWTTICQDLGIVLDRSRLRFARDGERVFALCVRAALAKP